MTDQDTLRQQWKHFANGAIHALYKNLFAVPVSLGAVFTGQISWKAAAFACALSTATGVWGWLETNDIPDVFSVTETKTVTRTVEQTGTIPEQENGGTKDGNS